MEGGAAAQSALSASVIKPEARSINSQRPTPNFQGQNPIREQCRLRMFFSEALDVGRWELGVEYPTQYRAPRLSRIAQMQTPAPSAA